MKEELYDKMYGAPESVVKTKKTKVSDDDRVVSANVIDYNINFFLVVRSWSSGLVESKIVEKAKGLNQEWTSI